MSEPFMKAGTEIRDDEGNLIATVAADVVSGQIISVDNFIWPGEKPSSSDEIHPAIRRAVNRY